MRPVNYRALECKNRHSASGVHEIRIPLPKLADKPPNPLETANNIPAVNVACPRCRHVYEYTQKNVHWYLSQILDQDPIPTEPISFAVEFVCTEPGCKALVLMHTMREKHESKKDVLERLAHSVFHVYCLNGHILHFPSVPRYIVREESEGPF
jgi:hypothetical protein